MGSKNSNKPKTKQEVRVNNIINKSMNNALKEYLNGTLSDSQINQETRRLNKLLDKESTKRLELMELVKENKLVKELIEKYHLIRFDDASYRQLLMFLIEKNLWLDKNPNKKKNPNNMKRKELIKCIINSDYYDKCLKEFKVNNLYEVLSEDLAKFIIDNNLNNITSNNNLKKIK